MPRPFDGGDRDVFGADSGYGDALTWAPRSWPARMSAAAPPSLSLRRVLGDYLFATLVTALAFALAFVAQRYLAGATLSLIFLTGVLAVAVRTRMSVAVYTALLCFFGYNFFFTPPRYTLAMARPDDVLAVVMFLVVALVCSRLATRLASQVASLQQAQDRARELLQLGHRLAASNGAQAVGEAGVQSLAQALQARVGLFRIDDAGQVQTVVSAAVPPVPGPDDREAIAWTATRGEPAGRHTASVVEAACWTLPLTANGPSDVLALWLDEHAGLPDPTRRELALAMSRDIGQALAQARLAEALALARVEGETERLRNALLSSVSHDLRSPLAAMIGAAGTLSSYDQQLPQDDRRQLMQSILDEGQRLDRYIQNLLDMTRLGHGTLKLHRDWVDAGEVVLAAVERVRRFNPGQVIELRLPTDTVLLYVHPALIEQALFNILENAVHFSPPQMPVWLEASPSGGQLEITVSDAGPGIPEDERARSCDMFYSVSRGDRGHKGTGLGLSICRGMIGAHGGSVEALLREGGGTTLRVTLPLPDAPESSP